VGQPIREAWRQAFRPRDTRPIPDWARDHVRLPPALSKNGPFEVAGSRHFIEIFAALQSAHVREVNVLKPVRGGGTLIADIWLPWVLENDPGNFLGVFQKDDIAKEHCELRTRPILQSVVAIMNRWPAGYRDRLQEMLFPEMPVFIWGPAIRNLQSKGFRYLWLDEPWLYAKGTIGEAKGRLGDYIKQGIDKLLCIAQGGFAKDTTDPEQVDDWYAQYFTGEILEWHVQCRGCKKYHAPKWTGLHESGPRKGQRFGMVWNEHRDDRGRWLIEQCKKSIRYVCPKCGHEEKEANYKEVQEAWNRTGKYLTPEGLEPSNTTQKKSFHWNNIISQRWDFLTDTWLNARNSAAMGDRTATIQFWQKHMAEFWDPEADDDYERILPVELEISEAEKPDPIRWIDPADAREILFKHRQLAVDVQMRKLYAIVDIWSDFGDDLTLWAEELESWTALKVLQERFHVAHDDVCIDINYNYRETDVAQAVCRHARVEKVQHNEHEAILYSQWIAYRGDNKKRLFPYDPKGGKRRWLPWNPEFERIDPCPGIPISKRQEDMLIRKPNGQVQARICKVFKWSEDTITQILDDRRTGRAKGIRSIIAPGEWNADFAKHMGAEAYRRVEDSKGHGKVERYKTRDDHYRDGKKMSIIHAIRRGRLNISAYETDSEEKKSEQ
jgi:hypothetical protein